MIRSLLALLLVLVTVSCAPKPPDLTARPPDVQRAFVVKDVLDQIMVLSKTAVAMNANGRLSDVDTGYVRDFATTAVPALEAYVPGGPVFATLVALKGALSTLMARLTEPAEESLAVALRVLQALINGIAPPAELLHD